MNDNNLLKTKSKKHSLQNCIIIINTALQQHFCSIVFASDYLVKIKSSSIVWIAINYTSTMFQKRSVYCYFLLIISIHISRLWFLLCVITVNIPEKKVYRYKHFHCCCCCFSFLV